MSTATRSNRGFAVTLLALVAGAVGLLVALGPGPGAAKASSHREAPLIATDPTADNTDLYAFVSPDRPDTVTIVANYIPFEEPAGGPNFFNFDPSALYTIHVDNNGDGRDDVAYNFRFSTETRNPETFLYNTGPIGSLNDPNWNKRQLYSVTRVTGPDTTKFGTGPNGHHHNHKLKAHVLGRNLASPPCNIGPRSTPNYHSLATAA